MTTTNEALAVAVASLTDAVRRIADERDPDESIADALNALCDKAFLNSLSKGFHDDKVDVGVDGWLAYDAMKIALMHSELSEALEELREGILPHEPYYRGYNGTIVHTFENEDGSLNKPEGVASELADVIIRIADYCGSRGVDLGTALVEKAAYNERRPTRHGKGF